MKTEWNLDILYKGLDDPKYEEDVKKVEATGKEMAELLKKAEELSEKELVESIFTLEETYMTLLTDLFNYLGFRQSVETENGEIMAQLGRCEKIHSENTATLVAFGKILGKVENVEELAKESKLIDAYKAIIRFEKETAKHYLSDPEEAMLAAMDMTGGGAWGNLQSFLTSTVKVDYKGEQITLSEVRNLAYDADAKVRKEAYEAELAAYEKIQDSVAFSLNNIKKQVNMVCEKKQFASGLDQSLFYARMDRKTLDAMMTAVEEYLPVFHKYLRKKGEILGHKNGLPFYDLFAPLATSEKKYSLEEARDLLTTCFGTFSTDLSDMIQEAFDNEWIDFYPRNGKVGGAFCGGLPNHKQSRVLTNYDGTFGAVDTLAHELGHAYHNRNLENERILNTDYPMPVAETASTFNEVFLGAYALKQATNDEEKLALLESEIKETTQCVVDIYSRYLFETAVFEQCEGKFLMANDLKEIMLDCQKKAYGDGLDPEFLHPYMWVCKSHYYSSGLSFYNYPYTFGNLFATGLYSLYLKEGDEFVKNYKEMLRLTPIHTMEEDGAQLGIDLTKPDFWRESLQVVADKIEEFCKLA